MAKHAKDVSKMNRSSKGPQRGNITKRQMKQAKYKRGLGSVKEGQGFADKKKHAVVHQYRKMLKKESRAQQAQSTGNASTRPVSNPAAHSKKSTFHKADEIRKQKVEEKQMKQKEKEETEKSQKEALKKYKQRKRQNFKKLAKVNYKGQPNLAAQMELLLQKIQKRKT